MKVLRSFFFILFVSFSFGEDVIVGDKENATNISTLKDKCGAETNFPGDHEREKREQMHTMFTLNVLCSDKEEIKERESKERQGRRKRETYRCCRRCRRCRRHRCSCCCWWWFSCRCCHFNIVLWFNITLMRSVVESRVVNHCIGGHIGHINQFDVPTKWPQWISLVARLSFAGAEWYTISKIIPMTFLYMNLSQAKKRKQRKKDEKKYAHIEKAICLSRCSQIFSA